MGKKKFGFTNNLTAAATEHRFLLAEFQFPVGQDSLFFPVLFADN